MRDKVESVVKAGRRLSRCDIEYALWPSPAFNTPTKVELDVYRFHIDVRAKDSEVKTRIVQLLSPYYTTEYDD